NTCDDTLVAVTAGHLIANAQFAFHRDENLDHLDHARRQFVALLELSDLLVVDIGQDVDLALGTLFVFANFSRDVDRAGRYLRLAKETDVDRLELFAIEHLAFLLNDLAAIL